MEIGWTDVRSGGYILVSRAHSNTSLNIDICIQNAVISMNWITDEYASINPSAKWTETW
jgi:hypothetical protein